MVFLDLGLSIFRRAFRFIGAVLCDVIYSIIAKIYELFITVARLNILSTDQIQPIYQRITMILTIVMVFYVTMEFVKYTISPDDFSDKEKGAGNVLKRVIIVIALIALVPNMFTMAYKLQNRIIETQLISKVILGTSDSNYTSYGNEFSANMLNLFYYYDEEACSGGGGDCSDAQVVVAERLNHLRTSGDSDIVSGINLVSNRNIFKETEPAIRFNGVLAIVVGGFIVYMLAMYSIDVGTRYAQLIFLQIISPIAIMGYILPKKDGIFQKWGKQCITTYIDLFLRIAIINFILLIIKVLGDGFQNGNIFAGIGDVSAGLKAFTYIALVMGLLAFARRAPKLLSELFPSMGAAGIGFGLSPKERIEPTTKAVKGLGNVVGAGRRVAGGAAGMVAGALKNRQHGLIGMAKGARAGMKAGSSKDRKGLLEGSVWRRTRAANAAGEGVHQSIRDLQNNAGSADERRNIREAAHRSEHWKQELRDYERQIANLEAMTTKKKGVSTAVGNIKFRQQMETMGQAIATQDATAGKEWESVKKTAEKFARMYADGKIDEVYFKNEVNNAINVFNSSVRARGSSAIASTIVDKDFELDSAKWGTVKTSIEEAKNTADFLAKNHYTYIDADGTEKEFVYDESKFAEEISKWADNADSGIAHIKANEGYKNAKAYSQGISETGGGK